MILALDHIALAARTLDEGRAYLRERLGVEIPAGGEHPFMGTHNALMALGEGLYFEIIAVAPHLPAPPRPRWFALDDPAQLARLSMRPRLAAWIARAGDIEGTIRKSPESLGEIVEGRRGDLTWKIAVAADGGVPMQGALPILIQWPEGPHVSTRMTDLGCRLRSLAVRHPEPDRVRVALAAIGGKNLVRVEAGEAAIAAEIEGPKGIALFD